VNRRGKTAIEDHFDVAFEVEQMLERRGKTDLLAQVRSITDLINVSYVRQKEPLGLGHASWWPVTWSGRSRSPCSRRRHHRVARAGDAAR